LGKAINFFVKDGEELSVDVWVLGMGTIGRFSGEGKFAEASAMGVLAGAPCHSGCNTKKPTGEGGSVCEGSGFADEDQEYGLEGVFDVARVVK
jgi:hypothetical protein